MYNGKLLTPDHGFPVRVIIPGYVGGRMIKWMTNIDLLATVSQDYYHFFDNRYTSRITTDRYNFFE
jgi:nitrate reductase (NAD(P)H)